MFTRRFRHVLIAVLITFSLAAAACSSGGGGSNDSSDAPAGDVDVLDDLRDSLGSGDAEFFNFNSSNCEALQDAFDGRSYDGSSDSLEETADFLRDAADNAPEEAADDLRVLADFYEQFVDVDSRGIRRNPDFVAASTPLGHFVAGTCTLGLDR